jgi:hypothetical protein
LWIGEDEADDTDEDEGDYGTSHMRESLDQQRRDDARLAQREAAALRHKF